MPIPNRAPDGGMYCPHGTFPDHCGACTGEYVAGLERQLEEERARVQLLREELISFAGTASKYFPDYGEHLAVQKVDDVLAATAPEEKE